MSGDQTKLCGCVNECVHSYAPPPPPSPPPCAAPVVKVIKQVVPNKLLEVLPKNYGYVVLVAASSVALNLVLTYNVYRARIKYGVPLPMAESRLDMGFNCILRAQLDVLEEQPLFLTLLLIGGLHYPRLSAGCGLAYLTSRVAMALGYHTGNARNRNWGVWGYLPLTILFGNAMSVALMQLKWMKQ